MSEEVKRMFAKEVFAQAEDARQRRAWKDGMRPMPPRLDWPDPPPVLPPAIVERPAEPVPEPKPGLGAKIATAAAIVLGTAGVGAGGAYLNHVLTAKEPAATQPAQPEADVVQWLGEHGYDRSPE